MKVIAGLGNPGEKYSFTRHNIGFVITGELASQNSITGRYESKFNAIMGKGSIEGEEVLIIQPQTFMNLSGESISKILNYYKLNQDDLIVVFDDLSLNLGKIRFRKSGSDGGHNGIKSIIKCTGGSNFPRLKVGIGPQPPYMSSEAFVLQKFSKDENKLLKKIIPGCIESLEFYLNNSLDDASNKYNGLDFIL